MVNRPLANRRPIGPLINLENRNEDGKSVIGVSGTPFPNREKNPIVATYVLGGDNVATLPREASSGMGDKIRDKIPGVRVDTKRGGSSSKAPFDNQAVVVTIPGDSLPLQDNELHKVSDTIDRQIEEMSVDAHVISLLIDQK